MDSLSIASQASAQIASQLSLALLQKTFELQAANLPAQLLQSAPVSAPSSSPQLGSNIDVMV